MNGPTPGPWIAQQDPHGGSDDWVIGIEGAQIDCVASCSRRDASVISAAPELLKSLRTTVLFLEGSYHMLGIVGDTPVITEARAAIAKAIGK